MQPSVNVPLEVARRARLKTIPKGQIVMYEGDRPHEAFLIKSGVIKIYDIDDQGNEKILHIVSSPAVVPFAFFSAGETPLHWFYTALTDVEAYVINSSELRSIMRQKSDISENLIAAFSAEVHELLVRLSSLEKTNVRGKLIAVLKFLNKCHSKRVKADKWRQVNFQISHQLIADLSGITRESTATIMKELQDEGIVRYPKVLTLEINKVLLERE